MAVSKIPDAFAVESAELLSSGFTANVKDNGGCWLRKTGRICFINMDFKGVNVGSSGYRTGVILPEGFRPMQDTSFLVADGSITGQSVGRILPDGTVNVFFGSTKYAQGVACYIC